MALFGEEKRAYQREWIKNRRLQWIAENGPCSLCSSTENLRVHHIDSGEKVSHRIWSWREERRQVELAKCCVLCQKCHETVHSRDARLRAVARNPHGTYRRYWIGCRCVKCVAANAEYSRYNRMPAWRLTADGEIVRILHPTADSCHNETRT